MKKVLGAFIFALSLILFPYELTRSIRESFISTVKEIFTKNPILYYHSENLHRITVIEQHTQKTITLFRSAQLSTDRLEQIIIKNNIDALLNLRNPVVNGVEAEWFTQEKALATTLSLPLVTIPLDSARFPTREEIEKILAFFRTHHTMLIHCQAGADRTGLAAALFILEMNYGNGGARITDPVALEQALDQLTISYGHYAWFHPAMKQFIRTWYNLRTQCTRSKALHEYDPESYKPPFDISKILRYLKTSH